MYKTVYNFWDEQYFPGFSKSLDELQNKSVSEYFKEKHNFRDKNMYLYNLPLIINDIERYYFSLLKLGYVNKTNYNNILNSLKNIQCILSIEGVNRKKYQGCVSKGKIYLNMLSINRKGLSNKGSALLNVSHELTHYINRSWLNDKNFYVTEMFEKNRKLLKKFGITDSKYISYGIDLLDEVVANEVSETIAYHNDNKNRPKFLNYKNNKLFGDKVRYSSNYFVYQEFQEIASSFVACLNFIGNNGCINDNLKKLVQESFSKDFIKKILYESDDDIVVMLALMGKIKEATYATYGLINIKNCDVSKELIMFRYLAEINKKTKCVNNVKTYS